MTSAAMPDAVSTTVPPAKSSAWTRPVIPRRPPCPPHHVGEGRIDEQRPQEDKQNIGRKLHALDDRARNQGRRDDREGHLEQHEKHVRDGPDVVPVAVIDADARQSSPGEVADEAAVIWPEGKRVAGDDPDDGHQTGGDKRLHEHAEDVLAAHHAAVKNARPGVIRKTRAVESSIQAVSPESRLTTGPSARAAAGRTRSARVHSAERPKRRDMRVYPEKWLPGRPHRPPGRPSPATPLGGVREFITES